MNSVVTSTRRCVSTDVGRQKLGKLIEITATDCELHETIDKVRFSRIFGYVYVNSTKNSESLDR